MHVSGNRGLCPLFSVVVVAHHRIGGHVNGEDRGQLTDVRFYPAPAVFKALTGSRILAAQKSAAHAAVDDVVPGRFGQRDQAGAGAGHDRKPA